MDTTRFIERNFWDYDTLANHQRKITEDNERPYMAGNKIATAQNRSTRRYYSTTMPKRNDFNMPSKEDARNTYQNRGAQYSSGSSSVVKTNSSSIPTTSRSYTSSNNSPLRASRNYSVPSNSGNRSSISSSGGRSSGGSSRSIKN